MASRNINVMLINRLNKVFERNYLLGEFEDDQEAVLKCLDAYIESLGYETLFKASEELWNTLKSEDTNLDIEHLVELANGLCKRRIHELKRVLYKHSTVIDDQIATVTIKNFSTENSVMVHYISINNSTVEQEIPAGSSVEISVIKNMSGYNPEPLRLQSEKSNTDWLTLGYTKAESFGSSTSGSSNPTHSFKILGNSVISGVVVNEDKEIEYGDDTGITYLFSDDEFTLVKYNCNESNINLNNLALGDSGKLVKIDSHAFCYDVNEYCNNIRSIIIPDTVEVIGDHAFGGLTGLEEATIGMGLQEIYVNAFDNCTNLKTLNFNAESCSLASELTRTPFTNCGKDCDGFEVIFGENVKDIPDYLFKAYTATGVADVPAYVKNITFGANVETIGKRAFSICPKLTKVEVPDSVKTISGSAFGACENLEEITIGEGVTKIGNNAFDGCNKLSKLTFNARNCEIEAASSKYLPRSPFTNCGKDSGGFEVIIGKNVERLPSGIFSPFSSHINPSVTNYVPAYIHTITFESKTTEIGNVEIINDNGEFQHGPFTGYQGYHYEEGEQESFSSMLTINWPGTEDEWNAQGGEDVIAALEDAGCAYELKCNVTVE